MTYSNENENEAQHELLKLDSRGHVLISPERRAELLEEFDRSGMTGAGFARHYGIKYTTFAHWIRMRKRANRPPKPSPDKKFLLVTGETPPSNSRVVIELPHGARVSVTTEREAQLVGTLLRSIGTGN